MPCRLLKVQSADDPAALEFFRTLAGRHDPGDAVEAQTRAILADVAARGDEAVIELTRHFDCPIFAAPLAVSQQELERRPRPSPPTSWTSLPKPPHISASFIRPKKSVHGS